MEHLEKTEIILKKEAKIAKLEKEIANHRRVIKSLRTRLQNLQTNIRDMERTTFSNISGFIERLLRIEAEFKDLMAKALAHKKIFKDKEIRKLAKELLESISGNNDLTSELFEQQKKASEFNPEDYATEDGEAKSHDPFAEFRPEVSKEEQRSHRKIYLRLSQAFHPDRARNEEEAERNHRLMQQITQAYQQHDIEALLEMERQYLEEEMDPAWLDDAERPTLLDSRIERLKRERGFLLQQKERLSEEIKNIRQSELGQTLTEYERGNRNGDGFEATQVVMETELENLAHLNKVLADALKVGALTPELEGFFLFEEEDDDDDYSALFLGDDSLSAEMRELAELLMGGNPTTPNAKPLFKNDEIVNVDLEKYFDEPDMPSVGTMRVLQHEWQELMGGFTYEVLPEASIISELSEESIMHWIDSRSHLPFIWIDEEDMSKVPKKKKQKDFDTMKAVAIGRKRIYKAFFDNDPKNFPPDRVARLNEILFAYPRFSDGENWMEFFAKNPMSFPFTAKIRKNSFVKSPPKPVNVLDIYEYDQAGGIIMVYSYHNQVQTIPLAFLDIRPKSEQEKIIMDDYQAWAKGRLACFL
ncbi:MAG: hypothetical protein NWR72_11720 [Bacteroidia bacterium]|nr:hypothetical protein [Bacteroidia bacterium]